MSTQGAAPAPARSDRQVVEDQLVRDHLPLVQHAVAEVASRIPRHVCRDDLESAAMLGLAQAARTYDPTRGIAFERHAGNRVRGALLDALRDSDWASRSVRSRARQMQRAADDLAVRLGRTPSVPEVAAELGIEPGSVHKLLEDVHRATVLNYDSIAAEGDAEGLLPADGETPDQVLLDRERLAYLADAVVALPERLRLVVTAYFLEERPVLEIAAELGVTESRVSQLRSEALVLLKDGLNAHLDPGTLPPEPQPGGRVARRKAAYYAAVAAGSDYRTRLDAAPPPLLRRAGEAVAGGCTSA
ncbi:MAG TPA: sigma-70 family RNA polymerase sigma factor [Actinomycetes bacterium]|jgi:RNA polymerase sigma factor for flagellar operon FliA|nr:sigma-70 family RNA polymerase sigma factor [Actinomycetes bacterium]